MSDVKPKRTRTKDKWTWLIAACSYTAVLFSVQMCARLVNIDEALKAKADSAVVCNERIRVARSAQDSLRVVTYYPACR